jgi:uncharacterized membrane protein YdbT with pleckstrin-like domain
VAVGVLVALVIGTGVGVVAGVVLVAAVLVAGFVRRMATVYVVTSQRLHIRRGILARRAQQTRIHRVQNVNIAQTVVDRIVRVGTVDFDTTGTDDSEFRFVRIASPVVVVAAVDRARRTAREHAAEPRFARGPGTTRTR